MQNRRLLYRTLIKILALLGVLLLLFVFVNSLFTKNQNQIDNVERREGVSIKIDDLQRGQIKRNTWGGRKVGILYRQKTPSIKTSQNPSTTNEKLHKSLNSLTRSQKAEYFVFFNTGDSGNCPLFYSQAVFKDTCSARKFDETGREITNNGNFLLQIPPHYFTNNHVVFGAWDE